MLQLLHLLDEELWCVHHERVLCKFQEFLARSHCDENFLFIRATDPFIKDDSQLTLEHWNQVYHRFIEENAPKECNFPESIRTRFDDAFVEKIVPSHETIEQARLHILNLLQDAYSKFQRQKKIPQNIKDSECQCHDHDMTNKEADRDFLEGYHHDDEHLFHHHTHQIHARNPYTNHYTALVNLHQQNSLTQENIDLVSPLLDKFGDFSLEGAKDSESEPEAETEPESELGFESQTDTVDDRSIVSSVKPDSEQKTRTMSTPAIPSRLPSDRQQKTLQQSQGQPQLLPLNPPAPLTPRLKKLHRYSVSSSSKGSTTSSSSSVSSQSPTVTNSSQKFSKLVHKLKFGRSGSSSGGQSGPQAWQ